MKNNTMRWLVLLAIAISTGAVSARAEDKPADKAPAAAAAKDDDPLDTCIVSGEKLGEMGEPYIMQYEGQTIKFCCKNCVKKFKKEPAKYLAILDEARKKKADAAKTPEKPVETPKTDKT